MDLDLAISNHLKGNVRLKCDPAFIGLESEYNCSSEVDPNINFYFLSVRIGNDRLTIDAQYENSGISDSYVGWQHLKVGLKAEESGYRNGPASVKKVREAIEALLK